MTYYIIYDFLFVKPNFATALKRRNDKYSAIKRLDDVPLDNLGWGGNTNAAWSRVRNYAVEFGQSLS